MNPVVKYNKAMADRNRLRVFEAMRDNLGITATEIANTLGLSRPTVGRHVAAIREGWKPEGKE